MTRLAAPLTVLLVTALVVASLVPIEPPRQFKTPECRISSLHRERLAPAPVAPGWHTPDERPVRLASAPARILSQIEVAPVPPLLELDAEQLSTWKRAVYTGKQVGFRSPLFDRDLSTAQRILLTLRPGMAQRIRVTAGVDGSLDVRQRALRTASFDLDGAAPTEPMVLEVPVSELIGGNWGDERHTPKALRRLEIRVETEAETEGLTFDSLLIEGVEASYQAPAAPAMVESNGVLKDGWHMRAGVALAFEQPLPPGVLSLYAAAGTDEPSQLSVRIGDQAHSTELSGEWSHHAIDTSGGTLRIENTGSGVLLLGEPMLHPTAPRSESPNILLVLADTLRADHVGAFGDGTVATPHLDRLALEGMSFGLAQSSASWTKPAIPTLLTGTWATTHQVGAHAYTDRLPPTVPTLQQALREAGYRTGSFSASPLGSTLSGLEHGFDTAWAPRAWAGRMKRLGHPTTDQLAEALIDWWEDAPGPVFAYVHAMEPHAWRRGLYQRPNSEVDEGYQRAVEDFDTAFGRMRDALEQRGLLDNTLVVFTSDHGESFGDHGVEDHGSSLYQSQVHIPLVFWARDLPSTWRNTPVGLADVAPTILDLVHAPPLPGAQGTSVRPLASSQRASHPSVPSARERFVWQPRDAPIYAWTTSDGLKRVRQQGRYAHTFDLKSSPCEAQTTRWPSNSMDTALTNWLTGQRDARAQFAAEHPSQGAALRSDDVRMLEAMGYLEPTGDEP